MTTADHTPFSAATEIASSLASTPSQPISVWWLNPDFPLAVALELLNQGRSMVWVVGSKRRAELAQEGFKRADIPFRRPETRNSLEERLTGLRTRFVKHANPFDTPSADRASKAKHHTRLTKIQRLQVRWKHNFSETDIGQPEVGRITILQASHLKAPMVMAAIDRWDRPVFVLDHLTDVHIRWKAVGASANGGEDSEQIYTDSESRHLPKVLMDAGLPHVYLLRDEWACHLLHAFYKQSGVSFNAIKTEFRPTTKLKTVLVNTDLGQSKYDGATCLALKTSDANTASNEGVQIVGTGVFAAIPPNTLSMSGDCILKQAVLKVSFPSPGDLTAAGEQAPHLERVFAGVRARDHVRTAMLAFDPASRKPELVIVAAPNMIPHITNLTGPAIQPRLIWPLSRKLDAATILPTGTRFQVSVLETLLGIDGCLLRGSRAERVVNVVRADLERPTADTDSFIKRSARLLLGIQNILCQDKLDFSKRDEEMWGISAPCDNAIRLVNKIFSEILPWELTDTGTESRKMLNLRREILALYRERRTKLP